MILWPSIFATLALAAAFVTWFFDPPAEWSVALGVLFVAAVAAALDGLHQILTEVRSKEEFDEEDYYL